MLELFALLTLGTLAAVWLERRALGQARTLERWTYLLVVAGCYAVIMADMLFPHSFALSPLLEKMVTGLFPQAAA